MAKVKLDALDESTAGLVTLLHEKITADSAFATIALNYDGFEVETRSWYSSLISEMTLLVGDAQLEFVHGAMKIQEDNTGLYSVVILTATNVITSSGSVPVAATTSDHGVVVSFSRSLLTTLEVAAPNSDPFDDRIWPRSVTILATYAGIDQRVAFATKGEVAVELLRSLRSDLRRG